MKSINKIFLIFASVVLIIGSCIKPDNITPTVAEGGVLEVMTPALNYVVGDMSKIYTVEFRVLQGEIKTTKVDVYLTFTTVDTAATNPVSNEILFTTIDVTEQTTHFETFDVTFPELIAGLQIDGVSLSSVDTEYQIGDTWNMRLVSTTSEGNVHENYAGVSMAVSTRYAGSYKCIKGEYWNPSLGNYYHTGDWPEVTLIKSVDAITYQVVEYIGPFDGNTWYFQVNDGVISYPLEWAGAAQLLNGQPLITCQTNPNDLINVCGEPGANTVVNDDVEGKDQLIMALGYYTAGSGPRQFYQVLEKNVN
jgi:hypothetical protein